VLCALVNCVEPAGTELHVDSARSALDGWSAPCILTDEGWFFLAAVLDRFNCEVAWLIKPRITTDILLDALTMAWLRGKPAPRLIHDSDRGGQYASYASQDQLVECDMCRCYFLCAVKSFTVSSSGWGHA
jgi:transposase InsO family protein